MGLKPVKKTNAQQSINKIAKIVPNSNLVPIFEISALFEISAFLVATSFIRPTLPNI